MSSSSGLIMALNFFHADYEATLLDTYGADYEDTLVVESGKVQQ